MRILSGLLLFFALAMPVLALDEAIPEPGLRYRVTGVAEGDQLNVRVQPGTDTATVGTISPQAGNIIVTGSRQKIVGSIWWELIYPGAERGTGWVNARFLTPETTVAEETDYPLFCKGTEPFWSVVIDAGKARYSLSGKDEQIFDATPWVEARGLRGHFVVRLKQADRSIGSEGFVVVTRAEDFCSDNMSDNEYPFNSTVILPDGEVLGGCCSRAAHL
jgi:uncharacterized membrane protein